jgi:uncharacterized protein
MSLRANSAVDFVIKISKFCNLRCSYCYEFAELGERKRMQLDQLRAFFLNVRSAVLAHGRSKIHFVWHGGEPLLIPIDYYERIGELQREVLGSEIPYANIMQTNLTILTDRHIEFLRSQRFFNHAIGVSFDVYGDQRVDVKGRLQTEKVLANLQKLQDAGIAFGAICVLARNTLPRIREIYRFYDSLQIAVRFLPFYKSADDAQVAHHALSFDEITLAFKALFDDWLCSENATDIAPLSDYMRYALSFLGGRSQVPKQEPSEEHVFLVDTNGDTYGVADTYVESSLYGNLFSDDFGMLMEAPRRKQALARGRERTENYCAACPYFGHCPGSYVAEATAEQRRVLREFGCPVRDVIGHIVKRLEGTAAVQTLIRANPPVAERPEIAIGA